jgi:hypothetical protein
MDTPTFHAFPNGAIMDALHIDVATGNALTTGQGSAPKMMLSWSVDGGATWKGNRQLSLGSYGERVRVTTRGWAGSALPASRSDSGSATLSSAR